MKLSLSAIPFYWPKGEVVQFYEQVATSVVDYIYLGETVCAKRNELSLEDWLIIADSLQEAGKQVYLSSLALVCANSDYKLIERVCNAGMMVEANDMAAVSLLCEMQVPFVIGSSINIYNHLSLSVLLNKGLIRWVPPVEMSGQQIKETLFELDNTQQERPEVEVFSYGWLPLAFSARCFSSRAKGVQKDNCQRNCLDDPEGLKVQTREKDQLFTLNGIQTLSGKKCNLLPLMSSLRAAGVDVVRVTPQHEGTLEVIHVAQQILGGSEANDLAEDECNGYWYGAPGLIVTG
ncbi:U32 family peptidase [Zooshikella harenae]|uniref:U32 family peptidase n=1 Tax=Zooshikella harenae TaxID=2827238 RepID=A0ABS5ZHT5_9GAMM|nr:U32 family peptidase [Zooshikella harenae]MBU2712846.1 U32 family peptidase [Zooshikella harenae]